MGIEPISMDLETIILPIKLFLFFLMFSTQIRAVVAR